MNTHNNETAIDLKLPPDPRFHAYLKMLRNRKNLSATQLASILNIHRNTQLQYEKSRDPNVDYLLVISKKLNVSFGQLIRKRIEYSSCPQYIIDHGLNDLALFKDPDIKNSGTEEHSVEYQINTQNNPNHILHGGPATAFLQHIYQQFPNQPDIKSYQQHGESMAPKIANGDWLFIDVNNQELQDGCIYFIELGQQQVARRIQFSTNKRVIIASDNEQYSPIELSNNQLKELKIIGKLVSYWGQTH